jgi:hypothetical protein
MTRPTQIKLQHMQELFHFQAIRRNSYSIFTTLVHIRHTQYTVVLLHGNVQIAVPLFSRFGGAPRVEREADRDGKAPYKTQRCVNFRRSCCFQGHVDVRLTLVLEYHSIISSHPGLAFWVEVDVEFRFGVGIRRYFALTASSLLPSRWCMSWTNRAISACPLFDMAFCISSVRSQPCVDNFPRWASTFRSHCRIALSVRSATVVIASAFRRSSRVRTFIKCFGGVPGGRDDILPTGSMVSHDADDKSDRQKLRFSPLSKRRSAI